jgi:hypothetical protein
VFIYSLLLYGKKAKVIRVDFSLRREVFFVVVGAIVGGMIMLIPKTILEVGMGLPYYLTWVAFGHIVGIYSPASVIVGITLHILTAISIGVIIGIFLYKSGILNISKISNGLIFDLLTGSAVFTIFFIPLQQFILVPEITHTMSYYLGYISQQ